MREYSSVISSSSPSDVGPIVTSVGRPDLATEGPFDPDVHPLAILLRKIVFADEDVLSESKVPL